MELKSLSVSRSNQRGLEARKDEDLKELCLLLFCHRRLRDLISPRSLRDNVKTGKKRDLVHFRVQPLRECSAPSLCRCLLRKVVSTPAGRCCAERLCLQLMIPNEAPATKNLPTRKEESATQPEVHLAPCIRFFECYGISASFMVVWDMRSPAMPSCSLCFLAKAQADRGSPLLLLPCPPRRSRS